MPKNIFKHEQFIAITEKAVMQLKQENPSITADEIQEKFNWNFVPRFPRNKRTAFLRSVFGQLSQQEVSDLNKELIKADKVNRGMQKIYAFLDRSNYMPKEIVNE